MSQDPLEPWAPEAMRIATIQRLDSVLESTQQALLRQILLPFL